MCPQSDPRPDRSSDPRADITDADFDRHSAEQVAETQPSEFGLLAAIAFGGVLGAEARYGLGVALPHHGAQFPWSTLLINLVGSAVLGALMVLVLERATPAHRLARPFLGVGIIGGFTTFSTFALDAVRLVHRHHPLTALAYVLLTLVGCQLAVQAGTTALRRLRGSGSADPAHPTAATG